LGKKKLYSVFVSYYKPHYKLFVLDMACALAISLIDLYFPMLTREVVGTVLPAGQMKTFWLFVVGLVAMYLIRTVFQYIVNYWGHILGVRMEFDMRSDLFADPALPVLRQKPDRTPDVQDGERPE